MDKLKIGKSGLEVSPVGLGCWPIGGEMYLDGISDAYSGVDDNMSIKAINRAIDLGINFFDTADCYGAGHSERVLKKALVGKRDDIVLATKFGYVFDEKSKNISHEDNSPEYIESALKGSLKRLGTDYIDLYQFHVGYIEEEVAVKAIKKLEELKRDGLIREIGWSTYDPEMAKLFPENLAAIQHPYNVLSKNEDMIKVCREGNMVSLCNSPLAMGLLGGKYKPGDKLPDSDVRSSGFDWVQYFKDGSPDPDFYKKIDAIREILISNGRTLAQGALAWIWGNSDISIPIPGFRTVKHVESTAGAIEKGKLSSDQIKEINLILSN